MKDKIRKLKKDILEPGNYDYLNKEESNLYDEVFNNSNERDQLIRKLLETKAELEACLRDVSVGYDYYAGPIS